MYLFNTGLCKNLLRAEGLDEGRAALCCISEWEKNSLKRKALLILLLWEGEALGDQALLLDICL